MPRGKTLQTVIPGFGRIYQPTYRDKKTGELKHFRYLVDGDSDLQRAERTNERTM